MRLTRECDYAFVVLVFLAGLEGGRSMSCDDIAGALNIPFSFLSKILQKLCRAGLIASRQGTRGGYSLTRSASEITCADVLRATGRSLRLVDCVDGETCRCPRVAVCAIVGGMRAFQRDIMARLEDMTVADLVT